jgi:hypothetical protein
MQTSCDWYLNFPASEVSASASDRFRLHDSNTGQATAGAGHRRDQGEPILELPLQKGDATRGGHIMTDALKRLIEATEFGTWDESWRWLLDNVGIIDPQRFSDAYLGSLDAAKAIHDALLPGCRIELFGPTTEGLYGMGLPTLGQDMVFGPDPARAWLLAILRAKLAQIDQDP